MTHHDAITIIDGQVRFGELMAKKENLYNLGIEALSIVLNLAKKQYHQEQVKGMENITFGKDNKESKDD